VADIPVRPEADPREPLGRLVRETWVAWAREQPRPWKASHLTGWDDLGAGDREVDMRIGAAVAAAERERLCAELGNEHFVIFTEDRWTVEHSVECRLSGRMHECAHHAAVARFADGFDPDMAGRWLITEIGPGGYPVLIPAVLIGGDLA
jgi:hypothetical protein